MASMAQAFNPAMGGIPQPGQPMGHHPSSNQGMPGAAQPGVTMSQPMHPGMAGPGMPQGSQAGPMMAMMPGGAPPGMMAGHPNAHAMQHLNPGQNQMFPGQQMAMNNPQIDLQRRQALMQRGHPMMAQQNGMPSNSMGPQMFQQGAPGMQGRVPLPPHLQQQQTHLAQLQMAQHQQQQQQQQQQHQRVEAARIQAAQQQQQQQAQQQQQHAQQQNAQANAQQTPNPQQQQNNQQPPRSQQNMAHQAAMQQAVSQAAPTQGQAASQNHLPPTSNAQQGRPEPSNTPGPREQAAHANQLVQPQQGSQNQGPPSSQPQQPSTQPQQPSQQQQGNQQTPQPQGPPSLQQQQAQQQRQAQHQQQMMNQQRIALMQQQRLQQQRPTCGALLRQFGDFLSQAQADNKGLDFHYWEMFVQKLFAEDAVLRLSLTYGKDQSQETKAFEILYPSLPRFYYKHFEGGVRQIQLHFEGPKERPLTDGSRWSECLRATMIYRFDGARQVMARTHLKAQFNSDDQLELLDMAFPDWQEYITLDHLKESVVKEDIPDIKQSPSNTKAQGKRAQQQAKQQAKQAAEAEQAAQRNQAPLTPVPRSLVGYTGLPNSVQHYLEFNDTMSQLDYVFGVAHSRGGMIPAREALQVCVTNPHLPHQMLPQGQQQVNQNMMNQMQMQNAAPFVGNQQGHFLSPAQVHQPNPPGTQTASPATLSNHNTPAMQNIHLQHQAGQIPPGVMAAPSMVHQASHQGTNPSAAGTPSAAAGSANASPNVGQATGKRRRASAIDDGDVNGSIVNGVGPGGGANQGAMKVKQSPKVGKKSRPNA